MYNNTVSKSSPNSRMIAIEKKTTMAAIFKLYIIFAKYLLCIN